MKFRNITKLKFSGIDSIRGTILDPLNKLGIWEEVSSTTVRLKQDVDPKNLKDDVIRKIAGSDFDKIWNILLESLCGFKTKKNSFEKLIINRASRIIVVLLRPHSSKLNIGRIFYRNFNDASYKKIKCSVNPSYSFESPITSLQSSEIYFNVQHHKLTDSGNVGGNWTELKSYDLKTGKARTILDECSLNEILGTKRTWIANLIGLTNDDKNLHCVMGIEPLKKEEKIGYYLSEITLSPLKVKTLTLLKNTFY